MKQKPSIQIAPIAKITQRIQRTQRIQTECIRLAAIDIGTHSVRCLVAEIQPDENYRLLDDIRIPIGLGNDLAHSRNISHKASQRLIAALSHIMTLLKDLNVSKVSMIATSAFRKAQNSGEIAAKIQCSFGIDLQIISGKEEAMLVFESVLYNFKINTGSSRFAVADMGGGSTEISLGTANTDIEQTVSLDIGAIYLTDRFVRSNPVCKDELKTISETVRAELTKNLGRKGSVRTQLLVGVGGTFTTLAAVHMAQQQFSRKTQLHGYEMMASDIEHTAMFLYNKTISELRGITGVLYDRAKIVPAGVCAAVEVVRFLGAKRIVICDRGLREGLILRLVRTTLNLPG